MPLEYAELQAKQAEWAGKASADIATVLVEAYPLGLKMLKQTLLNTMQLLNKPIYTNFKIANFPLLS